MVRPTKWRRADGAVWGLGMGAFLALALLFSFAAQGEGKMEAKGKASPSESRLQKATFAGGCFWCVEAAFDKLRGVVKATSGYTGGKLKDPSYEDVSTGRTGHVEAVQVLFDPAVITYGELLDVFWRQIDPGDAGGQFADRGSQYATAIFFHDDQQRQIAEQSAKTVLGLGLFGQQLATRMEPAGPFYAAEAYHQDYAKKSTSHYERYKRGSGRADFLEDVWTKVPKKALVPEVETQPASAKKPNKAELKHKLPPLTYHVTQERGTEPPFQNAYWNEHREGLYVDAVTGEPLFSSKDKYDSGSGWPSFTRPLDDSALVMLEDFELGTMRVEVRSRGGDSHLGHVFDDGPAPMGQRYCINSAALRFIPKEELSTSGYGRYLGLFER